MGMLKRRLPGALLGLWVLLSACGWADVVHFADGKTLRGKLRTSVGELFEFKPSFSHVQTLQRLTLANRRDMVEMRNMQKYFGEIIYANTFVVEIATASGKTQLSRLLIRNIVLGAPDGLPIELPAQPPNAGFPASKVWSGSGSAPVSASSQRVPIQPEKPVFMFPPAKTSVEDRDAINTDERLP